MLKLFKMYYCSNFNAIYSMRLNKYDLIDNFQCKFGIIIRKSHLYLYSLKRNFAFTTNHLYIAIIRYKISV